MIEVKAKRSDLIFFHEVVERGDMNQLRDLIYRDVNLNAKDKFGWTALHIAARYGDIQIASLLLSNGANVNVKDYQKRTPIHVAIENEQVEMFQFLFREKASVDVKDEGGNTGLHIAARVGNPVLLQVFLEKVLDRRISRNKKGETPLDLARSINKGGSHDQIISLLIK